MIAPYVHATCAGLRCLCAAADLNEVSFQALKDRGFQGVIFDKDNTLTLPHHHEIAPHVQVPYCTHIDNNHNRMWLLTVGNYGVCVVI